MKSRDTLLRLKRFQLDEKRRKVAQLEMMIAEFDRMAGDLDREIQYEEQKAKINDPTHFAYPTYARAAMTRRDNLRESANNLKGQLDEARRAVEEAFEELKKVETLDSREAAREKAEAATREQAEYDQIGLSRHAIRAAG
ncbi:flagellar export protein FliJ [Terrarubrum flagellatum]|uniref:flagellar export protein FliJ n=1 Tax=Terrirubrum flagellatum TaxID=2895980 RepID=UPI003144E7A7